MICGADDFVAIAAFGRKKRRWLSRFLDLRAGIPSHDRFNAILAALKPEEFEKYLLSWITVLYELTGGQVIAIDGKTLRRSFDKATGKAAIQMVSAWATANQISLGQVVVDAESNEITAIPKLLEILELSGALVTIDAAGCQTEIAQKILDGGGPGRRRLREDAPPVAPAVRSAAAYESKVYWNTGAHGGKNNHWLRLRFSGATNAELIGARVEVREPGTGKLLSTRWIHSNPSYKSGGALEAHFGLGKHPRADLTVALLSGKRFEFTGVEADRFLDLDLTGKSITIVEPAK